MAKDLFQSKSFRDTSVGVNRDQQPWLFFHDTSLKKENELQVGNIFTPKNIFYLWYLSNAAQRKRFFFIDVDLFPFSRFTVAPVCAFKLKVAV